MSATIEPIFITPEQAAEALALSRWRIYDLLNAGAIESRYDGRKRKVSVKSIRAYAEGLPTEKPGAESA